MIVVAGEALIDLIVGVDMSVDAALGGAPYNTARAAARLGVPVAFAGPLSTDRFGQRLAEQLEVDLVQVAPQMLTEAPTTLAAAEVSESGAASYRFYFDGTSAPALDLASLRGAAAPATVFFTGGLGLVLEPMASTVETVVGELADDVLVVVDVNSRPRVIADRDAYIERVERVLRRADVVKVSDEDLAYMSPDLSPLDAARHLTTSGVVIITAGSSSTVIVSGDEVVEMAVPAITDAVVDTIGAGDTFGGALLASLVLRGVERADMSVENVAAAVEVGHAAAGIVVTRRGADPPHRSDLAHLLGE